MDSWIVMGVLALFGYWCYRKGKRIGSVKGFQVGRRRSGRRR